MVFDMLFYVEKGALIQIRKLLSPPSKLVPGADCTHRTRLTTTVTDSKLTEYLKFN